MAGRFSRPLFVAPAIPLWGMLSFLGVTRLTGTPYVVPFVVCMCVLFVALFTYVARQAMRAKRSQVRRQKEMR